MGWRHPRITGADYDAFVEEFIWLIRRRWPDALVQFERFLPCKKERNATSERYKDRIVASTMISKA